MCLCGKWVRFRTAVVFSSVVGNENEVTDTAKFMSAPQFAQHTQTKRTELLRVVVGECIEMVATE